MLGFTMFVGVDVSVSDVMYFSTPVFAANAVQPNLRSCEFFQQVYSISVFVRIIGGITNSDKQHGSRKSIPEY